MHVCRPTNQGTSGVSFLLAPPTPGRVCPLHAAGMGVFPSCCNEVCTKLWFLGPQPSASLSHAELKHLRDDVGGESNTEQEEALRLRRQTEWAQTVVLPLPDSVALGMSISSGLSFLINKAEMIPASQSHFEDLMSFSM